MFIPDPGSWFLPIPDPGSRIPDPGSRIPDPRSKNSNKRQGWKFFFCQTIFCSHKFHKTEYYFIFDMLKKKIWSNFPRIIEVFTQKFSPSPQKYGCGIRDPGSEIRDPRSEIRDPRSGIRKKPIPDPGSRGQKGTGSRIRIRNTVCQSLPEFGKAVWIFLRIYLSVLDACCSMVCSWLNYLPLVFI